MNDATNGEREALPPLPKRIDTISRGPGDPRRWIDAYSADQMRDYARTALASRPAEPAEPCDIPPSGWACSRRKGHSGPCAAIPTGDSAPITKEFARRFPGTAAGMVNALAARVDELEAAQSAQPAVEPRAAGLSDEARDAARYRELNTPEIADFIKAVEREALHQRDRWGADGEAGKSDADWFWLIGYLAGKAIRPDATIEKRLHHIITTAAACLNWHGARVGAYRDMRPGIADPDSSDLAAAGRPR